MNGKWPRFETNDLDLNTDEGDAELHRRWKAYDREMRALIAKGGVHQDEDGWWIDDASGDLIGPDPEIERPLADDDLKRMRRLEDELPELAASIKRTRGRPRVERPKAAVTLRLDPDAIARFEAVGPDWRRRMAEIIERTKP